MWSKIKDLFKSIKTKSSDGYDEKYMKIKLIQMISYLYKTLNKTIFLRAIVHENNKNYPLI